MRRLVFAVGAAIAASLTAIGAGAIAANPTVVHFSDSGTFTDDNFCDTGETVNGTFDVKGTEWLTPNQADYRNTAQGTNTFTNPANGASVNFHFAGPFTATIVSFNEDGAPPSSTRSKDSLSRSRPLTAVCCYGMLATSSSSERSMQTTK